MILLLFLIIFSQHIFAGNLLVSVKESLSDAMQNYAQHLSEFPVTETMKNNLVPATGIMILGTPIVFNFIGLEKCILFGQLVESFGNLQNIVTTIPLRIVSRSILSPLNPLEKDRSFSNRAKHAIDNTLFWPTKLQNLSHNFAKKHTSKDGKGDTERWGERSYYLRTCLNTVIRGTFTITRLTWYAFLIYHIRWAWKKMQGIPATDLLTFSYRYGKNKLSARTS